MGTDFNELLNELEQKERRSSIRLFFAITFVLMIIVVFLYFSVSAVRDKAKIAEENIKEKELIVKEKEIVEQEKQDIEKKYLFSNTGDSILVSSIDPYQKKMIYEADEFLTKKMTRIEESDSLRRKDITVRVYMRNLTDKKIKSTVESLGFNVEVIESQRSDQINAIWFDKELENKEDVKIIAYSLVKAGVKLQKIEFFRAPKNNTIEIGSSSNIKSKRPYTLKDIDLVLRKMP